ncbi:protein doublesex-like, partial [Condylostylus longicornis]|uniref:protein doublesex-like n=1 Tax=Condylostylus longicornis TaxID=2530218 RepID=UPI00244E2487
EDHDLGGIGSGGDQSSARRNLRVVIIKAPENKGLTDAALQLAKSSSSDKTAVYVLTKQTDLGELQNKLAQSQDVHANKPEVHFVKYRTPEEAEHAQHSIQAQYNNLNGPTQISNEGVAPVQSFVGSVPSSGGSGGFGGSAGGFGGFGGSAGGFGGNFGVASSPAVQNTYLPPAPAPAPPPPPPQNSYIPPAVASPVVHNTYLPAVH